METFTKCEQHDVNSYSKKAAIKGGWKSAIFIIFVEFGERFAYYGVSGNLITYLMVVLKQPLATAAKNVNLWHGVSAIFPILGAFLADSFFGRFKTIVFSSLTYLLVINNHFYLSYSTSSTNLLASLYIFIFYIYDYHLILYVISIPHSYYASKSNQSDLAKSNNRLIKT
ncbi:putative proton-dependent oligopeptide transporter family, MFS transporter superfamily [Helianthus annuus]|nr:putative proton-dependent oligopeptide transporter family, MFS transporter superfamily [Helianthus annuus]